MKYLVQYEYLITVGSGYRIQDQHADGQYPETLPSTFQRQLLPSFVRM